MECPYCNESDYEYIRMVEQRYDADGVDEQFWLCECNNCHKEFIIKEVYILLDDIESMTMERFNSGKY